MQHLEDDEQIALFKWAFYAQSMYPELKWMFHIPNGGKRRVTEAVRLQQMGVKSGVSDVFLPCARGGYHGLWIEMKSQTGRATANQREFLDAMEKAGYMGEVCYGCEEAITLIKKYLKMPKTAIDKSE